MHPLQPIYQAPRESDYSALFVVGGKVPAKSPWFAIYLRSPQKPDPAQLTRLSQFLDLAADHQKYSIMAFLTLETGATAAEVQEFGARLDAHMMVSRSGGTASLMWLETPARVDPVTTLHLGVIRGPTSKKFINVLDRPRKTSFFSLGATGVTAPLVFVPKTGSVRVEASAAEDALVLRSTGGLSIGTVDGRSRPKQKLCSIGKDGTFEIPLTGPQVGCVTGQDAIFSNAADFRPAIRYGIDIAASGRTDHLSAPLAEDTKALNNHAVSISLSPSAPYHATRTRIGLTPFAQDIGTPFRTRAGHPLTVQTDPKGNSALSFAISIEGTRYLTPVGTFPIASPVTGDTTLLCGLSGVEYIPFQPGDALHFFPGQPAATLAQVPPETSPSKDATFTPLAADRATTAWAMLGPSDATSDEARAYISEPETSPFFATHTGDVPTQLAFLPHSRRKLTRTLKNGAPRSFPMLPFAGVKDDSAGLAPTFEAQCLVPARRKAINAPGPADSTDSQSATKAVTPQGHLATFENGAWTSLQTAKLSSQNASIDIGFHPAKDETALPDALQDAFLANHQFLVISKAPKALGTFTPEIKMNGWAFKLDPGVNKTPGSYKNVVIYKSAQGTLAQLAAAPHLWTERGTFTDTKTDRDGLYLSRWLVNYIDDARKLYDEGKGVASLARFCALVDDPNWNGFVALNVTVDGGALQPELEVLLAGVDRDLFAAHHIGNQINHISPKPDGGFDLTSAPFGLVHYADQTLNADSDLAYVHTPQDYDFRVLTLEAVFENAALTQFSNASLLLLNQMFGDRVPASGGAHSDPRNSVMLLGTYKKIGAVDVYTFASPPEDLSTLPLDSYAIDSLRVSRATMGVMPVGQGSSSAHRARFTLWGALRFLDLPTFDLLSFHSLQFQNLAVDMIVTQDATATGGYTRAFAFETGDMVLEHNALRLHDSAADTSRSTVENTVRAGSLLTQFPMKVSGFASGDAKALPEASGFRPFTTTEPADIRAANLTQGPWYAISFEMNLGSQGTQAANAPIAAEVLLAWATGGDGTVQVAPYFRLSGPTGASLGFDIQGVVSFGASDVVLNKVVSREKDTDPDAFLMIFESIALSVLSLSFPPEGSTNVFLMGDPGKTKPTDEIAPTLGWFGGYAVKDPPPPEGQV